MSTEDLTQQISRVQLEPREFNDITPLEDEEMNRFILSVQKALSVEEADADAFSYYSTPNAPGRSGTSFTTAKKYLLGWLRVVKSFHCSITSIPISESRVIQIAHMLLPQSASTNAIDTIGLILGIRRSEMSIHSRLFLMPLRVDVHILVDMHRIFMIPSKEVLKSLQRYLLKLGSKMPREDQESFWAQLRKGSLTGFEALKDGIQRDYTLLCSPHFDDQHPLGNGVRNIHRPYQDLPPIRTHVSPFAISIHALRVLECPDSPMSFNSDKVFRTRELEDFEQIQHLVELALLGLGAADKSPVVPPVVQDHARAFTDFVTAFNQRVVACAAREQGSSKSVSSGSLTRKGSIPDDSSHHSLRSSRRDAAQQPSTPTPSTRKLGGGRTRKKPCSSSPTPASQVKENYLAAHPPTSDIDHSFKGSKLFRRFLSRSSSEGSPKSRPLVAIPRRCFSSVLFAANIHFKMGESSSGK
ncbi:hypothetical protein BT96DRAFT_1026697 [Gymnopus androsaceus JB14]|uniref:Uncharacterized protein n=1 Tax=Gymnopus androsaceus JB14 TaxID=1447944 RepID=A0A6A4GIC7_9AGAR|nr:hypothetical protein BT96DRAFT_1026697 [Gymnopus androsaceus JB14]